MKEEKDEDYSLCVEKGVRSRMDNACGVRILAKSAEILSGISILFHQTNTEVSG